MPDQQRTENRAAVCGWVRAAVRARFGGEGPPEKPRGFENLNAEDAEAARLLESALDRFPSDLPRVAAFATRAEEHCRRLEWPDGQRLALVLRALPRFLEAERRQLIGLAALRRERDSEAEYFFGSGEQTAEGALLSRASSMMRLEALRRAVSQRAEEERLPPEQHLDRLDEAVTRLERLLDATRDLELPEVESRVARTLLSSLAEAVGWAVRARDWRRASRLRGRYLGHWHRSDEAVRAEVAGAPEPAPLGWCRRIGETVGTMHAKGITHGTLLLESFGSGGEVKNFERTRIPGVSDDLEARVADLLEELDDVPESVDPARGILQERIDELIAGMAEKTASGERDLDPMTIVEDLKPLYHQLSPAGWAAFCEGYAGVQSEPRGGRVLLMIAGSLLEQRTAGEESGYPHTPLAVPHFSVRACRYMLRHFPEARVDFGDALERAAELEDPRSRVRRGVDVCLEAGGVDDSAADGAARLMLGGIMDLIREHRAGEAHQEGERIRACIGDSIGPVRRHLLDAYCQLARSEVAADGDESAESLLRAARSLEQAGDRGARSYAVDLLSRARARVKDPALGATVTLDVVRSLFDRALQENDARLLQQVLALDLEDQRDGGHSGAPVRVYREAAAALLADDAQERRRGLERAARLAGDHPELSELRAWLEREAAESLSVDAAPTGAVDGLAPDTLKALDRRDWGAASRMVQRDLAAEEARQPGSENCQRLAVLLASSLSQLGEFVPHERARFAAAVADLVQRYGPMLLARQPDDRADRLELASRAGSLGWSAASLHPFLPERDDDLLDSAIQLLELAVRLAPREDVPAQFSVQGNNLALAYRARAAGLPRKERAPQLEKSAAIFDELIAVDQALRSSEDPAEREVAVTEYLDHFNRGLVCRDLGQATYDATWISKKPLNSARWYRQASEAFDRSRDLAFQAQRPENAATAQQMLASVSIEMCKYYVRERSWAGGDVRRALYDWFCTVEGSTVDTARFVDRHARSALANATAAFEVGLERNPALLLECVQLMIELWSLAQLRNGIPPYLERHVVLSVLESFRQIEEYGLTESFGGALAAIPDFREYAEALLRVDLFDRTTSALDDLRAAYSTFRRLSTAEDVVLRALARPRSRWFEVHTEEGGLGVNGLFVAASGDGFEVRLLSQRRSLRLGGVRLGRVRAEVLRTSVLKAEAARAVTYLEPRMDWADVPATLLVIAAEGHAAEGTVSIQAFRLPTASWDSWVLRVFKSFEEELSLDVSLPFSGAFDTAAGKLDPELPAEWASPGQVLIFGEPGITLEVTPPIERIESLDEPALEVAGTPRAPRVRVRCRETLLCLRSSPRVAPADVAWFVRDDSDHGAACCAASLSLASPSFTVPNSVIHSFAPLFHFHETVPREAMDYLNEIEVHEVVLVGVPSSPAELDAALYALFDPRRELFLLVEPGETEAARSGLDRLRRRVGSSLAARLLGVAGSDVTFFDPLGSNQVVEVPRSLAPAAAQMLLDLAALRRTNVEDIPLIVDGRPAFREIVGNPLALRRGATLFDGPVTWRELTDRYAELVREPLGRPIHFSTDDRHSDQMTPRIPKRPCFLLAEDRAALLAAIPYARHLGALILPDSPEGRDLCARLQPDETYVTGRNLPRSPLQTARVFREVVQQDHAALLAGLGDRYPHMVSSRRLLEEMQPSDYAVLAVDSERERPWAYLAANYAAALGAPLVLSSEESFQGAAGLESTARLMRGSLQEEGLDRIRELPEKTAGLLGEAGKLLDEIDPTFLGFVSSRASTPIELIGNPPLSTKFAIGRLAGPTLTSTGILIARAALCEDVRRPPRLLALLAEASEAVSEEPLPGARFEVESLRELLSRSRDIRAELLHGEAARERFLEGLREAHLVHFAGHGYYDDEEPDRSGLVFLQGDVAAADLPRRLEGAPIVFSNACESGVMEKEDSEAGGVSGWSGLAAAFIAAGAVNYLGSLWPIFDGSSRRISEAFYALLNEGHPVGEALRRARLQAYDENDPTWAAMIVFGCPRNRLRALSKGG